MPNRVISLERNTNETQIDLTLDLDGTGRYEVDTGCGFLNHLLPALPLCAMASRCAAAALLRRSTARTRRMLRCSP